MPLTHNGSQFFRNIQGRIDKFNEQNLNIVKGVGIQALGDLQQESPVDYGRYRAAHTLTIMEPSNFIPPEPTAAERAGHIQGDGLGKYTELAERQIANAKDKLGEIKLEYGLKIFITNNLDYAQYIEDGRYTNRPGAPKQIYGRVAARYNRIVQRETAKNR